MSASDQLSDKNVVEKAERSKDNHGCPGVKKECLFLAFAAPHEPGQKENPQEDSESHCGSIAARLY